MAPTKINEDTLTVIRECRIEENRAYLPGRQLDRKLYLDVKKVMGHYGGAWKDGKVGAFVFPKEAVLCLEEPLSTGKTESQQQKKQAFYTPDELADRVAALAMIESKDRILEPSAGQGALIQAVRRTGIEVKLTAVEQDPECIPLLERIMRPSWRVVSGNFLKQTEASLEGPFDVVVMNPPFTKGQALKHVLHAHSMLAPGGVLVSIVPAGEKLYNQLKSKFGILMDWHELPAGSFKAGGTMVNTAIVTAVT